MRVKLLLLLMLFTWSACGKRDKKAIHTTPEKKSNQRVVVSRNQLGLTQDFDDPSGPAAAAEQFNNKVSDYFKKLAKSLKAGELNKEFESSPFAQQLSDSYAGAELRPSNLREWQDSQVTIRRRSNSNDSTSQNSRSSASFQTELAKLLDFKVKDCKFKVTSVEFSNDGSQALTNLFVQIWGHTSKANHQVNTQWRCVWKNEPDAKLQSIQVQDFQEIVAAKSSGFEWSDSTMAVLGKSPTFQRQLRHGLDHWLDRLEPTYGIMPSAYQGLAIGDANGDGLDDLFVAQPGGLLTGLPNCLFIQQADGTAIDTAKQAGLNWNLETHCGLFVDLDNDGDQDLIVSTVLGLIFLENDGSARFRPRAKKLTPDAPPMSLCAADFDNDGFLDIYACCYANRSASQIMGRPIPYHDANNGGRNALFKNMGDWTFRNVTKRVGMDQNNRRFSFAAAWEDFDNDGDLDLYVANDYGRNNLFENHEGRFQDVAAKRQVEDLSAGMSVSWGDFNRDGWMDLYVSNMWSSAGKRIAYQRDFRTDNQAATRSQFQRHARGNSLFENGQATNAQFQDVSVTTGVTMGRWAWSSGFADLNNDGWQDLYVTNGFVTQEDTHDL